MSTLVNHGHRRHRRHRRPSGSTAANYGTSRPLLLSLRSLTLDSSGVGGENGNQQLSWETCFFDQNESRPAASLRPSLAAGTLPLRPGTESSSFLTSLYPPKFSLLHRYQLGQITLIADQFKKTKNILREQDVSTRRQMCLLVRRAFASEPTVLKVPRKILLPISCASLILPPQFIL